MDTLEFIYWLEELKDFPELISIMEASNLSDAWGVLLSL